MVVGFLILTFFLYLIPVLSMHVASKRASRRLDHGADPVQVMYRLSRFTHYFHVLYLFPFLALTFVPWFVALSRSGAPHWLYLFAALVLTAVLYSLLCAIYTYFTYPLSRRILELAPSRLRALWRRFVSSLGKAMIYVFIFFTTMVRGNVWINQHQWIIAAYLMIVFAILSIGGTLLAPTLLRARPMPPNAVPESWQRAASQVGLASVKFYHWPTKRWKIANAMATGLIRPFIIVSDYLTEQMTEDEAAAVIAHELGHLTRRHLWWTLFVMELWVPLATVLGNLLQPFLKHDVFFVLIVELAFFIGYQGLLMNYVSRRFEYQADASAAHLGFGSALSSALLKLCTLNYAPNEVPAFDELWMTHPSIAHRVAQLSTLSPAVPDAVTL